MAEQCWDQQVLFGAKLNLAPKGSTWQPFSLQYCNCQTPAKAQLTTLTAGALSLYGYIRRNDIVLVSITI